MARASIEAILAEHFRDAPGVCSVYLFGSQASGLARSHSDVDIGVLYEREPPATLMEQPFADEAALEKKLGRPVQIVSMNRAPVDLVHRIMRAERLVLDRNPSRRIAFEVRVRNEYFDLKPTLDRYRRQTA